MKREREMDFYNYQDARSYSVAYAKTRCVGSQRRAIKKMLRNQSVDEFFEAQMEAFGETCRRRGCPLHKCWFTRQWQPVGNAQGKSARPDDE